MRLAGVVLACFAALLAGAQPIRAAVPQFAEQGDLTSDSGYALLSWRSEEPVSLLVAPGPDFAGAKTLYRGGAHSFFLSGLDDGEYHLRLRSDSGAVSEPIRLLVAHQSLARALWLAAIGALITLAILLTILRGARDE